MTPQVIKRPLQADEILFFTHIPKTAGTTLASILTRQFPLSQILQVTNPVHAEKHKGQLPHTLISTTEYAELVRNPDSALAQFRLIRGHLPYDPPPFRIRQSVYMTMLREPIARLVSFYQHVKTYTDNEVHQVAKRLSFEEFVYHRDVQAQISNRMTAFLVGRAAGETKDLEEACRNLEQMAFVGITEYFADSMNLLHYTFDWACDFQIERLNSSVRPIDQDQIPAHVFDHLRSLNALDITLYERALRLFHDRCRGMAAELFAENDRLKKDAANRSAAFEQMKADLLKQTRLRARAYQLREDLGLGPPD